MKTVFVLVAIWTGGYSGSEVIVSGFSSYANCIEAGEKLTNSHRRYDTFHCVEVK